jgi:hypothetical protein
MYGCPVSKKAFEFRSFFTSPKRIPVKQEKRKYANTVFKLPVNDPM